MLYLVDPFRLNLILISSFWSVEIVFITRRKLCTPRVIVAVTQHPHVYGKDKVRID